MPAKLTGGTGQGDSGPSSLVHRLRWIDATLVDMYGPHELIPHGDAVGELIHIILTQNTSDANSDRTYAALRAAFPSWEAVLGASVSEIADTIKMGGLHEIKAARIIEVLRRIKADCGSISLRKLDTMGDEAYEYLTSLPGVGPKTAACTLLFALGRPVFPVDTHVHRVSNRLGLVATADPSATQAKLGAVVPPDIAYQLHMNMVTHGRRTCHASRPKCESCLLRPGCPWGQETRNDAP